MGFFQRFLPKEDRFAALMLYGMVFSTCFNGYDAGIMTVLLADKQFISYYDFESTRSGIIATIPRASTGLAQLFVGGTLGSLVGRLWALRISIAVMIIGVIVQAVPNTYAVLIVGRLITQVLLQYSSFPFVKANLRSAVSDLIVSIAINFYVAECAPRFLRGSFVGTVSQFGYQLDSLIAFWVGYAMSYHHNPFNITWRVSNILQAPIGLSFIVLSFWYLDLPRWLLEKYPENPERCLNALAKLRSGTVKDDLAN